jgi:hypothetical protein
MYTKRISPFDLVLTVEEFTSCVVDQPIFTDDDGYGWPVYNGMADTTTIIVPSKIKEIPLDATHIVWFNR